MLAERHYTDAACEVVLVGGRATVFDRERNKYYQTSAERLPREIIDAAEAHRPRVTPLQHALFLACLIGFLVLNAILALTVPEGRFSPSAFVMLVPYLVVSVAIHEAAHITALRALGRPIDGMGFKLNYGVFPAFYVRMNQSLLLARHEKVVVHGVGLLVNLIINAALLALNWMWWHSTSVALVLLFVAGTLSTNAVPALKSDGYRILLALTGVDDVRGIRRNVWWVAAIKLGSICYAAAFVIFSVTAMIMKWTQT